MRAVVRRVAGQEITSARILLNGHGLLDGRGRMAGGDGSASEIILDEEVTLVEGENTISVVASNAYADSETQTRSVTYTAPGAQHTGPNLYVLAIGISSYMHGEDGLDYCHLDAGDFVDECKKQEHGFYGQVTTRLLRNEEATRTRVLRSLQWLAKQATQHDMVFIFMAAHGSKDDAGDAYLVCHDTEPDFLVGSGVRWTDFPASLHGMPFRTVMFVDTCYSGGHGAGHGKGMARFQVDRDFTQAYKDLSSDVGGMVVFASSTAAEVSWEHAKWQNGAFTEALLEGMAREASHPRQVGEISDHELSRFVAARVKELTDGEQHPVWFRPKTVDEFTLLGVPTAK